MADARREATPTDSVTLAAQSEVSAEDVARAKLAAQRDGSALLNAMLHALPDEGM